VVAVVEIPDGIKVVSNLVGCDPDKVHIGMPVQLAFASAGEHGKIPVFLPASSTAGDRK
jgi:uncharacterized OB-fold protein